MSLSSQVLAFGMLLAVASGCAESTTLTFAEQNGYVMFVNRDAAPNTIFHIRGVREVRVSDGVFEVRDEAANYLIPQRRIVYAGKEFK